MASISAGLAELFATTKEAVAGNPAGALVTFTADNTLVGPTEVAVHVISGHRLTVDEPESMGGKDNGASPVEFALAALGSCQAITYRLWAAHLGIALDSVEIKVEGDLDVRGFFGADERVRPGLGAVRLKVALGGPESAARYRELADAVDRHCPVLDLFRNAVPVQRALEAAPRVGSKAA